jgi:hypothetical protein
VGGSPENLNLAFMNVLEGFRISVEEVTAEVMEQYEN